MAQIWDSVVMCNGVKCCKDNGLWRHMSQAPAFLLIAAAVCVISGCDTPFKKEDESFDRLRSSIVQDFRRQIDNYQLAEATTGSDTTEQPKSIAGDFAPWWGEQVREAIFVDSLLQGDSLRALFSRALRHSNQIAIFSDIPLIRKTGEAEAKGRFTPRFFTEGKYGYSEEPTGSTLQTGGPPRLEEVEGEVETGVRTLLASGAEVSLSQRLSYLDNNSVFLVPDPQSKASVVLSVAQPLLRGGGIEYNRSIIKIAELDSHVAMAEFVRQTEQHLMEVTRAYWNLYLIRALYLQKQRYVERTQELVSRIEARQDIDAARNQLVRSRAALAERRSDLDRSKMAIRNAEDRLRALINDPELSSAKLELIPADEPTVLPQDVDIQESAAQAVGNRPEVTQAFLQYRAALIRQGMAEREVLPQLDLVLEASLNGLESDRDFGGALGDQFDQRPSGLVGLRFETPLGEDESDARLLRRRLELRQQQSQVRSTIDTVLLEVRISVRETVTAYREMLARHEAVQAALEDVRIVQERWEEGARGDDAAYGYLSMLLDAQDRLAFSEQEFERSRVTYNVALINLERVKGTLLKFEGLEIREGTRHEQLPTLEVRSTQSSSDASSESEKASHGQP